MTLKKRENLIYLIIWIVLFLIPLAKWLQEDIPVPARAVWFEIFRSWAVIAVLLVLFLIHNFFILPFLLSKGKAGKVSSVYCNPAHSILRFCLYLSPEIQTGKDGKETST